MTIENQSKKQIKILLAGSDHDMVRLAAALQRTTMAEYCRDVVLAETHRLTKDFPQSKVVPRKRKGQKP